MQQIKDEVIRRHCYAGSVYDRINKQLHLNFLHREIEKLVIQVLRNVKRRLTTKRDENYSVVDGTKSHSPNYQLACFSCDYC